MKKIVYIVPYFGHFPRGFSSWLMSCSANPTIDWIIYTDDRRQFNYPKNVKVYFCTFQEFIDRIQVLFDFKINIDYPWRLCFFRPVFGEALADVLREYDFWGYCDVDLIWGNIRNFITDEILERYERIGFQGHSTLYKNTKEVNARYKTIVNGHSSYKEIFSGQKDEYFDENGMDYIYEFLGIDYYKETIFAHLSKNKKSFFLGHFPSTESYKNYRQVFIWNDGRLERYYLANNKVYSEEFMYIHFFCRPIWFREKEYDISSSYVIFPDQVRKFNGKPTFFFIQRKGRKNLLIYIIQLLWVNRKKITVRRILNNTQYIINETIERKGKNI